MSEFKHLLNPFQFTNHNIRTAVDQHGDVWFCAKDVCLSLEITWSGGSRTLSNMPTTWVRVVNFTTPQGGQDTYLINEPALYRLIFRSNKPAAEQFANWVCEEVLPSIRKNGYFGEFSSKERLAYSKQIADIADKMASTKDAMLFKFFADELRDLCNLIGKPMPNFELMGMDFKQLDLFIGYQGGAK